MDISVLASQLCSGDGRVDQAAMREGLRETAPAEGLQEESDPRECAIRPVDAQLASSDTIAVWWSMLATPLS
jgi:hypothetical protein